VMRSAINAARQWQLKPADTALFWPAAAILNVEILKILAVKN